MKFRVLYRLPIFLYRTRHGYLHNQRRCLTSFIKKLQTTTQARASFNGGTGPSRGDSFLVPGATAATLLMLGVLHARRLYDDKKVEEAREKGIEFEFQPDVKASFLRLLPLRSISRCWGFLTSVELPVWLRPYAYRAWARAFHSNLEEAALPLDEYASLRHFFVRSLKEGSRPIDRDPRCLVSPVDGTILRFGELKGAGAMIEQVKGFSYSVSSLLGASSCLPMIAQGDMQEEVSEQESTVKEKSKKSWWSISLASPKVWDPVLARFGLVHVIGNTKYDKDSMKTLAQPGLSLIERIKHKTRTLEHLLVTGIPMKGLFYCVIYLKPGDYHRIHSPADWSILVRRHFSGRLFPVNERAARTIKNLYVENERVVLEGLWQEGFMAMAAVGATNIGSIELSIEPELQTNRPRKKLLPSEPPEERLYEPEGVGMMLKKGDEVAAFNMGSTVVLVFQAPISKSVELGISSSEFEFSIKRGDRIRVGEALGRWHDL